MNLDDKIAILLHSIRLDWKEIADFGCDADRVAAARSHIAFCLAELRALMMHY